MRLRQGFSGAWVALAVAAADRVTKLLALRRWEARSPLPDRTFDPLVPGVLNLTMARNTGAAFSGFSGHGAVLAVVTAALIAGLVALLLSRQDQPKLMRAGLWMIVGGGLGNLYDRLVYGAVVDFLEPAFVRFAVFNVADACICVGAGLALLGTLLDGRRGGKSDG